MGKEIQNTPSKIKEVNEIHFETEVAVLEEKNSVEFFAIYLLYSDGSKCELTSGELEYDANDGTCLYDLNLTSIFNKDIKDKFIFNKQKVEIFVATSVFDNNFDFLSNIDTEVIELKLKGTKEIDFKNLDSKLSDKINLEYQHFHFSPEQGIIYLTKKTKFVGCSFDSVLMRNLDIVDYVEFNRCVFKNVFALEQLKCRELIIAYSTAENSFVFNHIEVYEVLELKSSSFQNLVSFYKFGFGGFVNISSSRYAQGINFSNIYLLVRESRGRGRFSSNYIPTSLYKYEHVVHNIYILAKIRGLDIKDLRTSISLIKQSLDSGGNSIDADKFYAMEMSIHFQEMKLWDVETGFRKILFFVNWFISDYYQSFGKAVLMFSLFNLFVAVYQVNGFEAIMDRTFSNMFIYYEMLANFVNMKHNELRGKVVLALINTYFYVQIARASHTGLKR